MNKTKLAWIFLAAHVRRVIVAAVLIVMPIAALPSARQEYQAAIRSQYDLEHGSKLFATCARCHGPQGEGAPDRSIPRIGGQHLRVVVKQLVDYRHDRRWDPLMEHVTDWHLLIDAQAVADVAAWVSQLKPPMPPAMGQGDLLARGGGRYAALCSSCHGRAGKGNARTVVPRIAGQHYEYLLRQMYDAVDGRRPNFPRSHVALLAGLKRDDLVALADFLCRLPWSDAKSSRANLNSF